MTWILGFLAIHFVADVNTEISYLKEHYTATQYVEHVYEASDEEREKAQECFMLSVNRQFDKALRRYRELLKEYPNSPELRADYIFFLDRRGRLGQARAFSRQASEQFPKSLRLKIIADHYDKIASTRSRQKRADLKQKMDAQLAAWTQIQIEAAN